MGGITPLTAPRTGHTEDAQHQNRRCHPCHRQRPGPAGNHPHPFFQALSVRRHSSGKAQKVPSVATVHSEVQQYPAVGSPASLPQPSDGVLVTGQFTVPAAHMDRQPHQRIVPVQHQTQAAQQRPQTVPHLIVAYLMGQHIGKLLPGNSLRQINGGTNQTKQAGTGQPRCLIYRQRLPWDRNIYFAYIQNASNPAQPMGKMQIHPCHPRPRQSHTDDPKPCQSLPPGEALPSIAL